MEGHTNQKEGGREERKKRGGKEGERAGVRLFADVELDLLIYIHISFLPSFLSPSLPPSLRSSQVPWFGAWSTLDISSRLPVREKGKGGEDRREGGGEGWLLLTLSPLNRGEG